MNNQRRKVIANATSILTAIGNSPEKPIDLGAQLLHVRELIETVRDDEQESFDNLPESLQEGSKGEAMTENIDYLEEAINCFPDDLDEVWDELTDHINNTIEQLDNIS